ncbi:hypothetical protein JCM10213_003713 [Rhodosporidiobolus nylandii]
MTPPSPSPSAAQRALRVASIVKHVLMYLIDEDDSFGHLDPAYKGVRPALCLTSLVSPVFRIVSQQLMHVDLIFDGGTPQMKAWLVAVQTRRSDYVNKRVVFVERPHKRDGEDDKVEQKPMDRDPAVLAVVLGKLNRPVVLWIQLESLAKLPAEAFLGENLSDLKILELPVPLTTSPKRPLFSLVTLSLHDRVPPVDNYGECGKIHLCFKCGSAHHGAMDCPLTRWGLPADWTNTIRFFSPPPTSLGLTMLHMSAFPFFSLYIRDFKPLARTLSVLALPTISKVSQRGPHAIELIESCHNIDDLLIRQLPELDILAPLLQAAPPSLQHLIIEVLVGRLGAGIPEIHPSALVRDCDCEDCKEAARDPVADLLVLLQSRRLSRITIKDAARISPLQSEQLYSAAERNGVQLTIQRRLEGLSCCEQSELDRMIKKSAELFGQLAV